jgi:hypothetical protein
MKRAAIFAVAIGLVAAAVLGISWKTMGGGGGGGDFPASVYPSPVSFPNWGPPSGCPSLEGVETPVVAAWRDALPVLSRFGTVSEHEDLRLSDRALWPVVRENWSRGSPPSPRRRLQPEDVVAGPASRSLESGLIARNCGQPTLARSVWIAVCPASRQTRCKLSNQPALIEHYLLLRRRHRWLVWWMRP